MKTTNNKKKQKTLNILSNPQFILGSIINPISNPFTNSFNRKLEYNNTDNTDNTNNTNNTDNTNTNNTNNTNNKPINTQKKEETPIDVFFGSIIEKPPSPKLILVSEINNINSIDDIEIPLQEELVQKNDNQINNQLKQIYPLINTDKTQSLYKNTIKQIFTNTEIKDKIDKLSENEMHEIFKIVKNNNEKYSTNQNGIFINISTLKKITINEICNFIIFCENNNKIFDQEEQTRDIYRDIILDL